MLARTSYLGSYVTMKFARINEYAQRVISALLRRGSLLTINHVERIGRWMARSNYSR